MQTKTSNTNFELFVKFNSGVAFVASRSQGTYTLARWGSLRSEYQNETYQSIEKWCEALSRSLNNPKHGGIAYTTKNKTTFDPYGNQIGFESSDFKAYLKWMHHEGEKMTAGHLLSIINNLQN